MKKRILPLLVLATASMIAVSCGGNSSSSTSSNTTPSSSSSDTSSSNTSSNSSVVVTYKVSVEESSDYTVSFDKEQGEYEEGDEVTITLTLTNKSKAFESFSCDDVEITTSTSTDNTVITGKFTMIAKNIEIKVNLVDVQQSHNIYKDLIEGGDISFSKTSAKAGETIEITVTPEGENTVDKFTSSVADVTFTTIVENEKYSFVMPDSNITIGVSFISTYQISKINILDTNYISAFSLNEGDKYKAGSTVEGTITFKYDVAESQIGNIYVHVNDKTYKPTLILEGEATSSKEAKVSFAMPSANAEITIAMSTSTISETGFKVTIEDNENCRIFGLSSEEKYSRVAFVVYKVDGYTVEKIEYKNEGETTWNNISVSFNGNIANGYINSLTKNITIRVTGKFVGSKHITYENKDLVKSSYLDFPEEITVGERVNISYQAITGYSITAKATINGVDESSEGYTNYFTASSGNISFIMPNNEVTITFNVAQNGSITIVSNDKISSTTIKSSIYSSETITSIAPNSTFYVFATAIDGYAVTGGKLNDGQFVSVTEDAYNGNYIVFTMPSTGDASITLETAKVYNVSSTTVEGGTIHFSKTSYGVGQEVTFNVSLTNVFYSLESVTCQDHPELEITLNGTSGSFIMPEHDVVLVPSFTKTSGQSINLNINDAESLAYYNVTGTTSHTTLNASALSGEFLVGEDISASVQLKNNNKTVKLVAVEGSEEIEVTCLYSSNTSYSFGNYKIKDTTTGFKIVVSDKTKLTSSIENDTDATLSFTVNGAPVEDLSNVLEGDTLKVTTSAAPSGYAYKVEITSTEEGVVFQTSGNGTVVTTNFVIKVSLYEVSTLTIVKPENIYSNFMMFDTDGSTIYSMPNYVEKNSTYKFSFTNYTYNDSNKGVVVTITGGSKDQSYTVALNETVEFTIEFTSDVTITFALEA